MQSAFPNDADGDALRRVASGGSDMSQPMVIDFQIAAPSEAASATLAENARRIGFETRIYRDDDTGSHWTCECSKTMIPDYDDIIAVQSRLNDLARSVGGHCDGWGTFGNVPPTPAST